MRLLRAMAVLLDAAATRGATPERSLEIDVEPRLAQVGRRPAGTHATGALGGPRRRGLDPPLAVAFPTQAARAALLDACLPQGEENRSVKRVATLPGR